MYKRSVKFRDCKKKEYVRSKAFVKVYNYPKPNKEKMRPQPKLNGTDASIRFHPLAEIIIQNKMEENIHLADADQDNSGTESK